MVNLNNKVQLVYNSTRSFDESKCTRISLDYHLPSAFSSAFADVDEPGAGGVGIVPGPFLIFLRGVGLVYCGVGRTQTTAEQTMRLSERMRCTNSVTSLTDPLCEVESINE